MSIDNLTIRQHKEILRKLSEGKFAVLYAEDDELVLSVSAYFDSLIDFVAWHKNISIEEVEESMSIEQMLEVKNNFLGTNVYVARAIKKIQSMQTKLAKVSLN